MLAWRLGRAALPHFFRVSFASSSVGWSSALARDRKEPLRVVLSTSHLHFKEIFHTGGMLCITQVHIIINELGFTILRAMQCVYVLV